MELASTARLEVSQLFQSGLFQPSSRHHQVPRRKCGFFSDKGDIGLNLKNILNKNWAKSTDFFSTLHEVFLHVIQTCLK
jgi:hypothetical protein